MIGQCIQRFIPKGRTGALVLAASFSVLLAGCGGGGSSSADNGGIGGSGITATGPIDSFGSIFVNGIEFETDMASIVLDSEAGIEGDLRLGMVVTVRGEVNGSMGVANSVEFDDDVQGPIASIAIDADGTTKTLDVLGLTVLANESSTVFDDVTFGTLAVNDVIEVSGFFNELGELVATRIEKKDDFTAGVSEIEIKGTVANLDTVGLTFEIGSFDIDYSGATLDDFPAGGIADGQFVEVEGTLNGTDITAVEVELEGDLYDDDDDEVSLEGIITDYVDDSNFRVFGQLVDASAAVKQPLSLTLQDGLEVEVEGSLVGGVLIAESVEAREGDIEMSAMIQTLDINGTSGDITVIFAGGGTVTFSVDSQTELEDETDTFEPFDLGDLMAGDFVEMKGLLDGSTIIATELDLEEVGDEVIQGPVESFDQIAQTITLFGVTYVTTGADFEDANDVGMLPGVFFATVMVDDIVKVQDDDLANGTADEVEFED